MEITKQYTRPTKKEEEEENLNIPSFQRADGGICSIF